MALDLICKYTVATSLSCFQSEKLETKGLNTIDLLTEVMFMFYPFY